MLKKMMISTQHAKINNGGSSFSTPDNCHLRLQVFRFTYQEILRSLDCDFVFHATGIIIV